MSSASSKEELKAAKEINCDILIIGSGAAGCTAAIYAARAALEVIIVSGNQPGGQLTITTDVENYPGFAHIIQGPWLMEEMQAQAVNVGAKIIFDHITKLILPKNNFSDNKLNDRYKDDSDAFKANAKTNSDKNSQNAAFKLLGDSGNSYNAKAVIIATGAEAQWLGLPSEKKFQGYGVSGCATCDGIFFKGEDVIVVGGGNTAVEEALFLAKYVRKIYLLHRRGQLRAEKILQNRLFAHENIEPVWNHVLEEVLGNENPLTVTGARVRSVIDNSIKEIKTTGIFIAIGHKPNTAIFKDLLEIDEHGYIITKGNSTKTNIPGIYAAGDVQDKIYRQAITAAGTGCMAALEATKFLEEKGT